MRKREMRKIFIFKKYTSDYKFQKIPLITILTFKEMMADCN